MLRETCHTGLFFEDSNSDVDVCESFGTCVFDHETNNGFLHETNNIFLYETNNSFLHDMSFGVSIFRETENFRRRLVWLGVRTHHSCCADLEGLWL